ncbi:hypothetical protein [Paenibacillus elgii]|uniref:hypothetical protein n=1 Tax=Paenibacillus elgii TaxID=189691 RepID=UPI00111270CC|nr:hypothetical protein [Paenibacillus elgii]
MNLKFIRDNQCPLCGDSQVIREEIETHDGEVNQHCNGGVWEKRTFSCGQTLAYIPNFRQTEVSKYRTCRNNLECKLRQRKREQAKEALLLFIDTLDVDDVYKANLKEGRFWI